jgi:hypothetical protein
LSRTLAIPEVPLVSTLPRPGGLIFDLDGTLVDTVSKRIDGWVEALTAIGVTATADQVAPRIGMDGRRLAREVAAEGGRELTDHELEEVDKAAGESFAKASIAATARLARCPVCMRRSRRCRRGGCRGWSQRRAAPSRSRAPWRR